MEAVGSSEMSAPIKTHVTSQKIVICNYFYFHYIHCYILIYKLPKIIHAFIQHKSAKIDETGNSGYYMTGRAMKWWKVLAL